MTSARVRRVDIIRTMAFVYAFGWLPLGGLSAQAIPQAPTPRDSIVVNVQSTTGRPLDFAVVELRTDSGGPSLLAHTNASGRARFERPRQSTIQLRVRRIGSVAAIAVVNLDTVRSAIEVVLTENPIKLEGVCTTSWDPSIFLSPDTAFVDDTSRVTLRVRDGAYKDEQTVRLRDWHEVGLAPERPGTYTIEVRAAGYRVWRRSGVRVQKAICHTTYRYFRVHLIPVH